MSELPPFDPNGYRKRVLAAVEKRGGPDTSDPFELYDLPLADEQADDPGDAAVAARIEEVWGFWQRQRDHPKYRVLVALLVETHAERSAELRDAGRRRAAAARVRAWRAQRDAARYELLDSAISRLVERHGGVPHDKLAGLDEVGALAGLSPAEVAARLRRHRVLDPPGRDPGPEPGIGVERRRQVRALLEEFGRLTEIPAPPTLLALLGLDAAASPQQVRASAAAWRARARELPPDRLRTVVDELLVHVQELLEPGRAAVEAYLDAVAVEIAGHLRPRVRAAVLVEDRLVAEDHAHLLDEAVAMGLDRPRATAVIAGLAAEMNAPIETGHATPPPPPRGGTRGWEEPLKAARAALRAGRPVEAQGLVEEARRLVEEQRADDAGSDGARPVRAVADEVASVLAEAQVRRRAAEAAVAARRWVEALEHLEHLERTAADVPGHPGEALTRARREVERANAAVTAAVAGPAADRTRALEAVLAACPGHPAALAALAEMPPAPPPWVSAVRDARGDVVVLWAPSDTVDVVYRVRRLRPDGSWQVVGRVPVTSIEDGGAPPGVEAPVYGVSALQAGRRSPETRSDSVPEARGAAVPEARGAGVPEARGAAVQEARGGAVPEARGAGAPGAPGAPPVPTGVRAVRAASGSVVVTWTGSGSGGVEYRVRCLAGGGSWRVVGRTRATSIEDGGAPEGAVPVYAVSAAAGGARSGEARSAGT